MILDIQTDGCLTVLGVLFFIRQLLKIVCFLVPMGLIVMLSIDFAKGVISGDGNDKKILSLVIKRLVFGVFLFVLPDLIFGLFSIFLSTDDSKNCWNYVGGKSLQEVREILEVQKSDYDDYIKILEEEQKQKAKEQAEANEKFKNAVKSLSSKNSLISSDGVVIGNTYNLTDKQLRAIAYLCYKEQGSAVGAAAEASLMANRFELYAGSPYKKNGAGLYSYIKNARWWAGAKGYMSNPGKVKKGILDAVEDVLVLGNRTLPLYVDEHDCIYCGKKYGFNVAYIVNDGKKITSEKGRLNRDNYIEDVTKIYNTLGAYYTFYSFPTKNSDPFGYTDRAYKKIKSKSNK